MEIIEVKQNWPNGYFKIEVTLGDICNYQCWYCWPHAHAAKYKWPDFNLLTNNLSHLLDYYIKNTDKKKFEIALLGGESTHWKEFIPFIKYFKERYDCIFTLITNGSKKLDWWKEAVQYLDQITISHHQKFCDINHLRELADLIYESNVLVSMTVLMDPKLWNECLESIEFYKKSRRRWSIRMHEVLQDEISYTQDQLNIISKLRARSSNPFYFLRVNKMYRSEVAVIDSNNKKHNVTDNHLLHNRLNNFEGWDCGLGVDWISIKVDGIITGACGNTLYNLDSFYNIYDVDFIKKYQPTISSTICKQKACWCGTEINMSKIKNARVL
jgi:organic radical activating enzyme